MANLIIMIIAIIAFILIRRRLKMWRGQDGGFRPSVKNKICTCIYVLFIFGVGYIMFGPLALPSTIDVKPLRQLEGAELGDMDTIIEKLEYAQDELGHDFIEEKYVGTATRGFSYSYSYYYDHTVSDRDAKFADVSIMIYENSSQAKKAMKAWHDSYPYLFAPYRSIKISDDIEARLYWSNVVRHIEAFLQPYQREACTRFRIDNIVIEVLEDSMNFSRMGEASSIGIEKLCGVLTREVHPVIKEEFVRFINENQGLENVNITVEDLDGVDIDGFIKYKHITEYNITLIDYKEALKAYLIKLQFESQECLPYLAREHASVDSTDEEYEEFKEKFISAAGGALEYIGTKDSLDFYRVFFTDPDGKVAYGELYIGQTKNMFEYDTAEPRSYFNDTDYYKIFLSGIKNGHGQVFCYNKNEKYFMTASPFDPILDIVKIFTEMEG